VAVSAESVQYRYSERKVIDASVPTDLDLWWGVTVGLEMSVSSTEVTQMAEE
jgi:hypothetical protein